MKKNRTSISAVPGDPEENRFFLVAEDKIIFKNDNQKINVYLDQISNVRLIKNRDFTVNIVVILFGTLFYLTIVDPLNFNTLFQQSIIILLMLAVAVNAFRRNYSYKLLINNKYNNYQEIAVSKRNLRFAEIFVTKFSATAVKSNKANSMIEINYQNLEQNIA